MGATTHLATGAVRTVPAFAPAEQTVMVLWRAGLDRARKSMTVGTISARAAGPDLTGQSLNVAVAGVGSTPAALNART